MRLSEAEYTLREEIAWADVLAAWRVDEQDQHMWREHYEELGYKSWDEWRAQHTEPLQCATRKWFLYEVADPLRSVPRWRGGPHRSWIERYYEGRELPKFSEIVKTGDMPERAKRPDDKIGSLIKDFPDKTTIIGLYAKNDVVVLEGTHRCCALALMAAQNMTINSKISLAIADFGEEKLPTLSGRRE